MKFLLYLSIYFTTLTALIAQDTSSVKPKFNYLEFNVNSNNAFSAIGFDYLWLGKSISIPYPNYYNKKINSFNSINVGIKINHHKLTLGLEYNPFFNNANDEIQYKESLNGNLYKLNIKANYFFYFSKKQKKWNHFLQLNFNTQTIKDYLTPYTESYEIKKGYAYGLGYGISFYIKKRFLIEPSFLINTTWFKDKDVYIDKNYYTTAYTTEIGRGRIMYTGIGLKLGYIINLKPKTK